MKIREYRCGDDYLCIYEDLERMKGKSYTLKNGTETIACFGLAFLDFGRYGAWLQHFGNIKKYKYSIIKAMLSKYNEAIKDGYDIKTYINPDFPERERFAKYMGFKNIGNNIWQYFGRQ